MSKEAWFRHFERLQAEFPDERPDLLAEIARERMIDEPLGWADLARLREREQRE